MKTIRAEELLGRMVSRFNGVKFLELLAQAMPG